MGQEIISHQETKEHEIVHQSFKVKAKRNFEVFEFEKEVFSDDCDFDKLKLDCSCQSCFIFCIPSSTFCHLMASLFTFVTYKVFGVCESFTQDVEMSFMSGKSKHDKIGISSINTMAGVRVIIIL